MATKRDESLAEEVVIEDGGTPVQTIIVEDKYVKVTPKETLGLRFIGVGWIDLVKDKEITVTQDQKRVLKEAGVIYI